MHNETVYCKECGEELAWWDQFTNMQYKEEWECTGEFRKKTDHLWRSKDGKMTLYARKPDKEHPIKVNSEMKYCALCRHTKYCRKCAYKLKFRCSAPRCKGIIRKVRNEDGTPTKYGHGGW